MSRIDGKLSVTWPKFPLPVSSSRVPTTANNRKLIAFDNSIRRYRLLSSATDTTYRGTKCYGTTYVVERVELCCAAHGSRLHRRRRRLQEKLATKTKTSAVEVDEFSLLLPVVLSRMYTAGPTLSSDNHLIRLLDAVIGAK